MFKLAVSTLGCPDWSFDYVMDQAEKMGYQALEIRGVNGEMSLPKMPEFSPENVEETWEKLRAHHLEISDYGTSISFHDEAKFDEMVQTGYADIEAMQRVGIQNMRIFGNNIPDPEKEDETIERVARGINLLCSYASTRNVNVWLEVHGDFNTLERIQGILEQVQYSNFAILWDVAHSDKVYGDNFRAFYKPLRPYIRHLHFKDHIRLGGQNTQLTRLGEGEIPLKEIIRQVASDGYEGYYSLEWEKKWHPDLPDASIAFPDFVKLMREVEAEMNDK